MRAASPIIIHAKTHKQQDRDLLMNKFITSLCLIALLFGSPSRAMDSKSVKLGEKLILAAWWGNF
jgi:hypothetical protein